MSKLFINRLVLVLSVIATIALLFNMVAIPVYKYEVLEQKNLFTVVELIILVCFIIILFFNITCFIWGCQHSRFKTDSIFSIFVLLISVLSLIMMFGEKTMIDEIAREYELHWQGNGEWIILYIFFTIQLIFNLILIYKFKKKIITV